MASPSVDSTPRSPPADGPINRLIRSFSSPRSILATPAPSEPPSEPRTPASDFSESISEVAKSPKPISPTPLERFWKHARRSRTSEDFPPVHWLEFQNSSTNINNVTVYKDNKSANPIDISLSEELEVSTPNSATLAGETTATDEGELTPQTFARRVQSIISSVPPTFSSPDPFGSGEIGGETTPQTPTQVLSPIADSKLLSFLSSPKVMNGPLSRGQQSVWSILERLHSPLQLSSPELTPNGNENNAPAEDTHGSAAAVGGNQGYNYNYDDVTDDGSSMMLCSPLIPQRDSLVELAETEYVSFDELGRIVGQHHRSPLYQQHDVSDQELQDPDAEEHEQQPLVDGGKGKQKDTEQGQPAGSQVQSKGFQWPWSKNVGENPKKPTEKRVWVPSTTKISLQTTWWGYRIYLPPPVLEVLNNKQLEAAKRAAMITAALKWLLDNIPVAIIPPQLQLALKLVKSLVPLLGYIGGFIAWSWSGIKQFDHGCGVTLTATWLLPIALVPGTWQAYEVPPISRQETPGSSPTNNPPTQLPAGDHENNNMRTPSTMNQPSNVSQAGPEPEPEQIRPSANEAIDIELPDGYHDSEPARSTSNTQTSIHNEQSIYEESIPTPVDAESVYHGTYYQIQWQPMDSDATNMDSSQMVFFPPPVVVRTVPLPGDSMPPRSFSYH